MVLTVNVFINGQKIKRSELENYPINNPMIDQILADVESRLSETKKTG